MVLVNWEMIVVGDGRFTLFRLVFVLNFGDSVNKFCMVPDGFLVGLKAVARGCDLLGACS